MGFEYGFRDRLGVLITGGMGLGYSRFRIQKYSLVAGLGLGSGLGVVRVCEDQPSRVGFPSSVSVVGNTQRIIDLANINNPICPECISQTLVRNHLRRGWLGSRTTKRLLTLIVTVSMCLADELASRM